MNLILIWTTTVLCVTGEITFNGANPFTNLQTHNKSLMMFRTWESVHGYFEVRPGAHLFYWLFYADGTSVNAKQKPLVIWVQGGPGFAASGVGNFAEIGPFNMNMQPRNHTWLKGRNVLFIDHPVGSGFSYASDDSLYVKTDREMAIDLSRAIKMFLKRYKNFRNSPTYVIGQSYGGKICPRLGLYLYTAIENKSLKMNLKGIGIGGGWVHPKESTAVQADFMYHAGIIDRNTYLSSAKLAKHVVQALDKKKYSEAITLDDQYFEALNTDGSQNYNNVYAPSPYPALEELNMKVNLYVKPLLIGVNQTKKWHYMSYKAYESLKDSFLLPSTSFLETLLNKTKLKIAIYNGNLDAVTPLAGASNWVHKLNWHGASEFSKAKRYPIRGKNNGYYKEMKSLSFWWVFGAGHWIPEENPEAMEHILEHLMGKSLHVN